MTFDPIEIERLSQMLMSSDERNVLLALELVEQQPEVIPALERPFVLLHEFSSQFDYEISDKVENLLEEHLAADRLKELKSHFEIFDCSYNDNRNWLKVKECLDRYEAQAPIYEALAAKNRKNGLGYSFHILSDFFEKTFKNFELAYRYRKKAIEFSPNFLNYKLQLANLLVNQFFSEGKRLEEVPLIVDYLKEGIRTYPSFEASYLECLGVLHDLYLKDRVTAEKYYREALDIDDEMALAANNLANLLYKFDGNYTEARRLAKIAVRAEKHCKHYLDTLASIEWKGFQNYKRARSLFKKALKEDAQHHYSVTGLGEVYHAEGKYDDAILWYLEGLKIHPKSAYKNNKLADLYRQLGKTEQAKQYYLLTLKYQPEEAHATKMLKELKNID